MKRLWADYSAPDFARLDRTRLVAVLPVGGRQHSPHLPLSLDRAILDGLIAEMIPRLAPDLPVLFLRTQAVGKSDEHRAWASTLTLTAETLIRVWTEIGANSHGGQMAVIDTSRAICGGTTCWSSDAPGSASVRPKTRSPGVRYGIHPRWHRWPGAAGRRVQSRPAAPAFGTGSATARRETVEQCGTSIASPSSRVRSCRKPWVWRSASPNTARKKSAARIAMSL